MFKTAARKIAHNSTIPALSIGGNKDLKPLQDLINAEKAVIISLQKLNVDFAKSSEAVRAWGLGEGDDLGDILSASTTILAHFSSALSQYAAHGHFIRDNLKSIRTREEALDDLKRRRRSVHSDAESAERKLSKMSPEHKNLQMQTDTLNRLRDEIRQLDSDIMTEEAALGDFKRSTTKTWMGMKFGGLLECCEKGTIAGEYGKLVISEIPEEVTQPGVPRSPYYGHGKIEGLVAEAHRCISEVVLSTVPGKEPQNFESLLPSIPGAGNQPGTPFEHQPQGPHGIDQQQQLGMGYYNDDNSSSAGWPHDNVTEFQAPHDRFGETSKSNGLSLLSNDGHQSPQSRQPFPSPLSQQYFSNEPKLSLDDFGLASTTRVPQAGGPVDKSNAAGGRFATFPVKGRQGYTLRDDPPSLSTRQDSGGSLEASITEALAAGGISNANTHSATGEGQKARESTDGPAPPYQDNFARLPPGAAAPAPSADLANPWASAQNPVPEKGHARNESTVSDNDDALLAYMTRPYDEHDERRDSELPPPRADDESKHVRFGSVSDIDEETVKDIQHQRYINEDHVSPLRFEKKEGVVEMATKDKDAAKQEASKLEPNTPTASTPRFQSQNRIPPPVIASEDITPKDDPKEEERALNAAAAREISRELDALNFSPPAQINLPFNVDQHSQNSQPQNSYSHSNLGVNSERGRLPVPDGQNNYLQSEPLQREPSPLLPPSAPFAKRSVSPHPYAEMNNGAPYTPAQSYAQSQQYSLHGTQPPQSPAQAYAQSFQTSTTQEPVDMQSQSPPRLQTNFQSPALSSSELPSRTPVSPRFQSAPSQAPLDSPYEEQLTNPVPPRLRNLSQPSVVAPDSGPTTPYRTPPEYPRTLSNAPFARSSSSLASPVSGPRTISAAAFKRPQPRNASMDIISGPGKRLPSSPYPQRGQESWDDTSEERELPPAPHGGHEDDEYDYVSAYIGNDSTPNPHKGPGYGEGRFATDPGHDSGLR